MGSPSPASPVTQTTQISQMDPRLYQWLYGTTNSPGRLQIANASMLGRTMQGVQNADPTALAAFYNVPKGTDLSQFRANVGAMNPGQADPSTMHFQGKAVTPQDYYKQVTAQDPEAQKDKAPTTQIPTQIAKAGGELRGYAGGGKPKLDQPTADVNDYGLTGQQQKQWDNLEKVRNSGKKMSQSQIKTYNSLKDTRTQYREANPVKDEGRTDLSLRDAQIGVTPFFDANPKSPTFMQSTNPYYNKAVDVLKQMGTMPSEYGQASDAYKKLAEFNYKPQDVTAQQLTAAQYGAQNMAAPQDIQAQGYTAAQMQGKDAQAAQANRGDIRDIAAQLADVERYNAANIERTQREQAATTTGPKSWTDPGVAQQYMNPYQQAVIDQSKFESNRQFQQNLNALRGGAAKSKAYGGTRQAMQEAEALRNQGYTLEDIQNKGLAQAYQQGMGQFSAEQGLGAQVGMSNTAQINQLKQQYMSMGLSEAQANQAAINTASQFNASAQNTAYNNYAQQQLAAQQANQAMDWNAVNLNTQNQQQTNLANQQYGQGGFQAQQQNMAAQNAQQQQYVQNALAAAQTNYGGQLTAAQQNQVAQNAAAQWNANSQNQIGQANQQANLTAGIQNQQANLTGQGMNLQAWNQAGQGLLNTGQGIGNYNQNLMQNWGAAGNTLQNLAQGYYDKRQQSAQNLWGGVGNTTQPATGTLLGSPWGTSYQGQYQQRKKGGKLSIKV